MRDFLVYVVGHSIANIQYLYKRWHTAHFHEAEFNGYFYCFSVPGATIDSYLESQTFQDLCNAPKPHLSLILIGGNDIHQETVVKELQYKLIEFIKTVEKETGSPSKCFMIEPRTQTRNVDPETYNKIRNLLNRNL